MTGMGNLLPALLPPIGSSVGSSSFANESDILTTSVSRNKARTLPSLSGISEVDPMNGSSIASNSFAQPSFTNSAGTGGGMSVLTSMPSKQESKPSLQRGASKGSTLRSSTGSAANLIIPSNDEVAELVVTKSHTRQRNLTTLSFASFIQKKETEDSAKNGGIHQDLNRFDSAFFSAGSNLLGGDNESVGTATSEMGDSVSVAGDTEDLVFITSKPFTIPFDSKNCLVQIFSSKKYDENLYLKVVSSGIAFRVYSERALSIDKAYEIINAGGHSSQIVHSADGEDLASLSALLIDMFQEADDNGDGKLFFSFTLFVQCYLHSVFI